MSRLSLRTRIDVAAKAFWSGTLWPAWNRQAWTWTAGGSEVDYGRLAGDPKLNSAIMACIQWVQRTLPEAPPQVVRPRGGQPEAQVSHPLAALLRRPNPAYGGRVLWQATAASYNLTGDAFWIKVRNPLGQVIQLWHEPPLTIRARWAGDGQSGPGALDGATLDPALWIHHYEVWRAAAAQSGRWYPLPVTDVVHFRFGLDPVTRGGCSPLAAAAPEAYTDQAAQIYTATLLRNLAVPSVIISPLGDNTINNPDDIKRAFQARFGGDRRGEPLVLDGGVKVDILTFPPAALNLRDLRKIPEERVSALLGVPAVVAGLGAGLDRSTFANMAEAREAAYEANIIPTLSQFGEDLTNQLLQPEFARTRDETVEFDTSRVRVLQDDQNRLYARQAVGYNAGYVKRGEARRAVGLPTTPDDDEYKAVAAPLGTQAPPKMPTEDRDPTSV